MGRIGSFMLAAALVGAIESFSQSVWTAQNSKTSRAFFAAAWTGSRFVAVGNLGQINNSVDGVTWQGKMGPTLNGLHAVAANGSQAVAAAGFGGTIRYSRDGADPWSSQTGARYTG